MEGGESPLEVLSRAATMLQEASEDTRSSKQLPTTKWKRERRARVPEYTRKSDPKIAETFGETDAPEVVPLDMSVRQRGLPPSYAQTVSNPGYKSSYRPSVIQNNREDLPPGISMCDPIIDEHFRRSLGNDYLSLFSSNKTPAPKASTNVRELMDPAGMSVDEHFAKALGDTWVKLNKKEQKISKPPSDNLVTI